MIPRYDVVPEVGLPAEDDCGYPSRDEISEEGFGFFRGTWFIGHIPVSEARRAIEFESELVTALDVLSADPQQFELLAREVEDYEPGTEVPFSLKGTAIERMLQGLDDDSPLGGLEIGVAGLAYALSATGFLTAASCRAHETPDSWSDCPVVLFGAHKWRAVVLAELAAKHGCGVGQDRNMLTVYATSILDMMKLAREVLAQRVRFKSRPGSRPHSNAGVEPAPEGGATPAPQQTSLGL